MTSPTTDVTTGVRMADRIITMYCEPVSEDWAITPTVDREGRFMGSFTLTHRLTGYNLPVFACIACVRSASGLVARSGWPPASWTPDAGDVPTPNSEVVAAISLAHSCDADRCGE